MIEHVLTSIPGPVLTVLAQTRDIDDEFNWPMAIFLVGTTVAVFGAASVLAWQIFATWRAKMSVAREEAYRDLALQSANAMERTAEQLERATAEIAELRQRTAELERMLREV